MEFARSFLVGLFGMRIAGKSPRVRTQVGAQLEALRRSQPVEATLERMAWRYHLSVALLISSTVAPLFLANVLFPPVQRLFLPEDGLAFFNNGQYPYALVLLFLCPAVLNWVFTLLLHTSASFRAWGGANHIYERQVWIQQIKAPKTPDDKHALLEEIAGNYDANEASRALRSGSIRLLVLGLVIAFPLLAFSANTYTVLGENGIRTKGFFTQTEYPWSEVHTVNVNASGDSEGISPQIEITFSNEATVDLWQFGLVYTPTARLLDALQAIGDHNIFILNDSMPDTTGKNARSAEQIQAVFRFVGAGPSP